MSELKLKRLASNKAWKERNKERVKEINRARNAAVQANPKLREMKLAMNRTSAKRNASKRREYDLSRDKIKVRDRAILRDNIYRGKIQRMPCEVCGETKSHAHHDDYSKPLQVKWLCPKHHKELHNAI